MKENIQFDEFLEQISFPFIIQKGGFSLFYRPDKNKYNIHYKSIEESTEFVKSTYSMRLQVIYALCEDTLELVEYLKNNKLMFELTHSRIEGSSMPHFLNWFVRIFGVERFSFENKVEFKIEELDFDEIIKRVNIEKNRVELLILRKTQLKSNLSSPPKS